jgi:hypothetical protein
LPAWELVLLPVLSGCSKPPTTALFPLDEGRRWVYAVNTQYENNTTETETLALSALGQQSLEDGRAWRRRSDSGIDYWLRSDETGVYRVASKSDLDDEPKPDKPVRYVLKTPLTTGTTWQASTTAYLLRRRQEFPPEIRHSHPAIPMTYSVDATDQVVKVPAGEFKGCLRVRGQASLRLFADPVVGWKDMPLVTLEWYCPGVGLVRLERNEPANSTFLMGGTQTLELTEWQ